MSKEQEESSVMDYVVFIASAVLCVWAIYTTFIVMGAMLYDIFEDGQLRWALALILALICPVLTAMGANSRKEGAQGVQRLTRVALGSSILSAGCAVIVLIALPHMVVPHLEDDPNWFMSNPHVTTGRQELNRKYSRIIAGMGCRAAHAAGTYYCPPQIGR